MTDAGQQSLGDFATDRPEAEARAVAGAGSGDSDRVIDPARDTLPEATGTIELGITQVDYTIAGRGDEERPIIHIFGRTADGTAEHVRVNGFRPYFYAPAATVTEADLASYDRVTGWEETNDEGTPYQSIREEQLIKIYGQTPRDVGEIRNDFDHYEADILFPDRFLIDKDINSGIRVPERRDKTGTLLVHHEEVTPTELITEPRVCMLDIEVDDRHGFPEDGEEPIVCLTAHDAFSNQYVCWLYKAPDGEGTVPADLANYEFLSGGPELAIRSFETEAAMLADLINYVETKDIDVLSGWNFTDFDAPYLLDRLEQLNPQTEYDLDIERLSRVSEVWRSDWNGPSVKGRVVFDLLYAYQRTKFTELDSYRLDDVAEMELDVGKERYPGDIGDLWESDPERLLEYNLRDVELCVELNRTQDIIPFWNEVRSFVGCKLEDATTPGDAVDMYVLHKVHGDFVLPSKGKHDSEDYEGGAVFDPITGVREMVSVLDLKCFSGDTDILTPEGMKQITEIEVGDPVYTLNPETLECEIKPAVETQAYDNTFGELHHLRGETYDFKITENHRFLVGKTDDESPQSPEDVEFMEYRDLADTDQYTFPTHQPVAGANPEQFVLLDAIDQGHVVVYGDTTTQELSQQVSSEVAEAIPTAKTTTGGLTQQLHRYQLPVETFHAHQEELTEYADQVMLTDTEHREELPPTFAMDDWLQLIGWYITDGTGDRTAGEIRLSQQGGTTQRTELLDRMGIEYVVEGDEIRITHPALVAWFTQTCGSKQTESRLPEWVFDLDGAVLKDLLRSIQDSGKKTDDKILQTTSETLRDDIVDLIIRCGKHPTVANQSDGTWQIETEAHGSFTKATDATVEEHNGNVYCLTAKDNHVVLAGRNGHFQWVGQSLYPMCMVTINASPETRVDPDTYDGETYRAPNGTRFQKSPDGVIREMVDELLAERETKKERRNQHSPGSQDYERFDRQQAAVKVIMNCFTPDTDVLTPEGVRNIQALETGDTVYSINPDTLEMEEKAVTETWAYPDYNGELVDIKTDEIDFRVTPNHRMLVRETGTETDFEFVEAGNLAATTGYELPDEWTFDHAGTLTDTLDIGAMYAGQTEPAMTVPDGGIAVYDSQQHQPQQRSADTDWVLELLGWSIAAGEITQAEQATQQLVLRTPAGTQEHVTTILDAVTDQYHSTEQRVICSDQRVVTFVAERCGLTQKNKQIPTLVFKASAQRKRQFLSALLAARGHDESTTWQYQTTDACLRDDLLRLATQLGIAVSYTTAEETWIITGDEDATATFEVQQDSARSTAEDGAYCVTVEDNHTLLAGRNGTFQWVGQSLYGVLGWDRFRLYDKEMGAAVTATGREVISHTEAAANEIGHEVVYGDTDSVMLELGDEVSKDGAIEQSFDIEKHINSSYDHFAKEELNAHEHRFQIEFEKLYRRFFQAGKKKRYAGHIVWSEGKDVDTVDITGFEYQRSDIAPITKEVQREVIERIVYGDDINAVTEYLHEIIDNVLEGELDPEEVAIPGGIGKRLTNYDTDTAQVRGARYANLLLGTNFNRGSKPKRVYLKKVHPEFFRRMEQKNELDPQENDLYREFKRDPDVICFEYADQLPDEFEIDWEKMLDKTLKGPIERILEALDVSWEEVRSGQEQTGLGQFM